MSKTIQVKDLADVINSVGTDKPKKLYTVCWDCNLGGVFYIAAQSADEARDMLVKRIEQGITTQDDLDVFEERVYVQGEGGMA